MSCLNCVSAHRRGRFWFCNRCGNLMPLRPVRAHENPHVSARNAGAPVLRQQDRNRQYPRVVFAGNSVASLRPDVLGHEATTVAAETSGPEAADVPGAVVLDLGAARRIKDAPRPG